jgi:membrane fusion protein (multidrug efflux system)
MHKKKIIGSILAVIAIFAMTAKFSQHKPVMVEEKPTPPQSVSVQSAFESKTLVTEVSYPATVIGDQEINVTAKSAGTVSVATHGLGDKVSIGTLLARIDDTGNVLPPAYKDFQSAQVQQSQLSTEQAQESLAMAQKNYKNLKKAYDDQKNDSSLAKTVSKAQVDNAKGQIDIAELQLTSTKISLKSTLDNHLVTSPITGIVTRRAVAVGDSVSVGQLIATISKSSNIKIQFYVDQNQRNALESGQEISALGADGNLLPLKISGIAVAADQITKRFLIEAFPSNSSGTPLLAGTILTVMLKNDLTPRNSDNLILPLSAINVGQNESSIFIADNGRAKKVPVTIASVTGETAEVSATLSPTTLIITDGSKLVHDGEAISINQ